MAERLLAIGRPHPASPARIKPIGATIYTAFRARSTDFWDGFGVSHLYCMAQYVHHKNSPGSFWLGLVSEISMHENATMSHGWGREWHCRCGNITSLHHAQNSLGRFQGCCPQCGGITSRSLPGSNVTTSSNVSSSISYPSKSFGLSGNPTAHRWDIRSWFAVMTAGFITCTLRQESL